MLNVPRALIPYFMNQFLRLAGALREQKRAVGRRSLRETRPLEKWRFARLTLPSRGTDFETIGQLRPVVTSVALNRSPIASRRKLKTGVRRNARIYEDKDIFLLKARVSLLFLSLYQNDSSFTMTTMISRATPPPRRSAWMPKNQSPCWSAVPIGARERVARSRFASVVRGIEIIIITRTILIAHWTG